MSGKYKCNRDCFNCFFDDCICDSLSEKEREDAKYRDAVYMNYGYVPTGKGHTSKRKKQRNYQAEDNFWDKEEGEE